MTLRRISALGILLFALGCGSNVTPSKPPGLSLETVQIVKPKWTDLQRFTTQPATIHPDRKAEVYARITGYLKELKPGVDIGKRVKAGEVLAVVDIPELTRSKEHQLAIIEKLRTEKKRAEANEVVSQAALVAAKASQKEAVAEQARARAQVKADQSEQKRIEELIATRAATDKLLIEVRKRAEASQAAREAVDAAFEAATAQVSVARAKLDAALLDKEVAAEAIKVAQKRLEEMEELMGFAEIKAPFAGIITERTVDPGDLIQNRSTTSQSEPLFTIVDCRTVRARVSVPENDAALAVQGRKAVLRLRAFPKEPRTGVISRIADSLDPSTRTMAVEIDFPNPDGKILSGMYGEVTIVLESKPRALTLESDVVRHDEEGKAFVYVVRNENTVHIVSITTGIDNGKVIEIVGGLNGEERIVGPRIGRLEEGQKVRPRS